jgi:hypothetical protein
VGRWNVEKWKQKSAKAEIETFFVGAAVSATMDFHGPDANAKGTQALGTADFHGFSRISTVPMLMQKEHRHWERQISTDFRWFSRISTDFHGFH